MTTVLFFANYNDTTELAHYTKLLALLKSKNLKYVQGVDLSSGQAIWVDECDKERAQEIKTSYFENS